DDRWTRLAVASSVPQRAGALVALLGSDFDIQVTPARLQLVGELAALVGARRDPEEVARVVKALSQVSGKGRQRWQMAGLNGVADGLGRRGTQLGAFVDQLPKVETEVRRVVAELLHAAAAVARDAKRELPERVDALRLMAHAAWQTASPVLTDLLTQDP